MPNIQLSTYSSCDSDAAIALEHQCVYDGSLGISFDRTRFETRSSVYAHSHIATAWSDNELVATAACAKKTVRLHGEPCTALYGYDLRVHPNYRSFGTARKVALAALQPFIDGAHCLYTFTDANNRRAVEGNRRMFGVQRIIPCTYVILPCYKAYKVDHDIQDSSEDEVRQQHIMMNEDIEFYPEFSVETSVGNVASIKLDAQAGCSLWSNENILRERLTAQPRGMKLLGRMLSLGGSVVTLPQLPRLGETIRSLIVYDLHATSAHALRRIINAANNTALQLRKQYMYILLQNSDPLLRMLRSLRWISMLHPYYFFAKGQTMPDMSDKIYIDVRDL